MKYIQINIYFSGINMYMYKVCVYKYFYIVIFVLTYSIWLLGCKIVLFIKLEETFNSNKYLFQWYNNIDNTNKIKLWEEINFIWLNIIYLLKISRFTKIEICYLQLNNSYRENEYLFEINSTSFENKINGLFATNKYLFRSFFNKGFISEK